MKEWSKQNEYCSFNSWKGLTYINQYRQIANDIMPIPIEASIDLTHLCQLDCNWCNSYEYLNSKGFFYNHVENRAMPAEHLMKLLNFLLNWGISGVCFGGGGESTLNSALPEAIKYVSFQGADPALVTNGVEISNELLEVIHLCRWIGISVDVTNASFYHELKGGFSPNIYYRVLENIKKIVAKIKKSTNSKSEVSFKYLIVPENINGIIEACSLAKILGVNEFHTRPASTDRREVFKDKSIHYDTELINMVFEECHELENEGFKVITSSHKFSSDYRIKNDFSRCWASPLQIQCCADGYVYVCQDQRINPKFRLGSHYPNPENILNFWGKEEHIKLLKSITPREDCPRCTYGPYQKQIEEVVIKDRMCLNFP